MSALVLILGLILSLIPVVVLIVLVRISVQSHLNIIIVTFWLFRSI